jgi:hypothetical protein
MSCFGRPAIRAGSVEPRSVERVVVPSNLEGGSDMCRSILGSWIALSFQPFVSWTTTKSLEQQRAHRVNGRALVIRRGQRMIQRFERPLLQLALECTTYPKREPYRVAGSRR